MAINEIVQSWYEDPEFKDLPLSRKERIIAGYFNEKVVSKDPEDFEKLTEEDQRRILNNFVENNMAPHRPKPPSRGLLPDIMVAGGRAAIGIPEMFLHAGAALDEAGEKYIAPEGGGFDLKTWARKKARDIEGYKEEELPLSEETLAGGPREWLTGGIEAAGTSLGIKLPAAVAGFIAGGPPGAILGWLSGVPLFSMAQYDQSLLEYRKRGVPESEAREAALLEGASEGGFELLTDIVEIITLGTGTVLTAPGKAVLKKSAFKAMKGAWKQAVKKGGVIAGAETLGELANVATQAEIRRGTGIDDQQAWGAIKENLGSIAVASLIFGGLGGGLNLTNARVTRKVLEDPAADPLRRIAAVKEVANSLRKTSPEVAKQWTEGAVEAVTAREAISLDVKTEIEDAIAAAKHTKVEDIPKPAVTQPMSERGVEATEIGRVDLDEELATLEELEEQLSPGQISFIKDQVKIHGPDVAAEQVFSGYDVAQEYAKRLGEKEKETPDVEEREGRMVDLLKEGEETGRAVLPEGREREIEGDRILQAQEEEPVAVTDLLAGMKPPAEEALPAPKMKERRVEVPLSVFQYGRLTDVLNMSEAEFVEFGKEGKVRDVSGEPDHKVGTLETLLSKGLSHRHSIEDIARSYLEEEGALKPGAYSSAAVKAMQKFTSDLEAEISAEIERVEPKAEPEAEVKPARKPKEPTESQVRTLRGRIRELGGINFLNYTGELRDMPLDVKVLAKKTGDSIDNVVDRLVSDGWLDKGSTVASFLEDLRTKPEMLQRDRITRDVEEKKEYELSPQEKRLKKEEAWEPEAPPEGEYVRIRAEDLPEGKEFTIIEGKSREGWDRYEVKEKDPFSVTLMDGEEIELKPLDIIEVLREEIEEIVPLEEIKVKPPKVTAAQVITGKKPKVEEKRPDFVGQNEFGEDLYEDEGGRYQKFKNLKHYAPRFVGPQGEKAAPHTPGGLYRLGHHSFLTPEEIKSFKTPVEKKRENPRTAAIGVITGGKVDQAEEAGWRFGWADEVGALEKGTDRYYDLVGILSGGKVEQLMRADLSASFRKPTAKVAPEEKPTEVEKEPIGKPGSSDKLALWVENMAGGGQSFTWKELFEKADQFFEGTQAEGAYTPKDAYDAMELGINRYISESLTINPTMDLKFAKGNVKALKGLIEKLPTQTKRTEETDEFQQFSTPPPLAYIVNWVANIGKLDVVLEPSAGVGGIAAISKLADPNQIIVNELSPRRTELLKLLGFDNVFTENAEQLHNILPKDYKPSVIVMNPPFSSTAGRIRGKRATAIGAKHIEQALARLEPDGRLVAIVGKGMAEGYVSFKPWWDKIKAEYNVQANIGIDGKDYRKYGTTFDNQILVIDKTGKTDDNIVTGKVESFEDLLPLLEGVRNARIPKGKRIAAEPGREEGIEEPGPKPAILPTGREPGVGEQEPEGGIPAAVGKPGEPFVRPGPERGYGVPGGRARPTERPAKEPDITKPDRGGPGTLAQPTISDATRLSEAESAASQLQIRAIEKEATGELTEDLYESYTPELLEVPGGKKHPTPLVQSAAMAAVTQPKPTYTPSLPQDIIKKGKLSKSQIESIVYAGQSHDEVMRNGSRRGYFIGDGTGVGKGREIAGVLWDNWNKGRKRSVWISEKAALLKDAQRDVEGTGWNPKLVFPLSKIKSGSDITAGQGVLFTTYDTLKSSPKEEDAVSRLDQIVTWLGKDFDGVIAFDESHNMGNAISIQGPRGKTQPSAKALAGVELQQLLPNARILYVSATGATDVRNLSYAERLGLWGEGTSFPNKIEFINSIAYGGIAAMEMIAQNMKATGVYTSRSLSYDGVEYDRIEHDLTPAQVGQYNKLADAWQVVLENFNEALELTDGIKSGQAKGRARAIFWGSNQRFFNQVITSMQLPSVINRIHDDLKAGNSVVIQLVNTLEAAQERALAKLTEEEGLEDLDLSPFDDLMQMVERSFPVAQFQGVMDDEGNVRYEPVYDSKGDAVQNAEAVELRDKLLDELGALRREVADGAIDQIIAEFGVENVAEVTGRRRRVVEKVTERGTEKVIEKRSPAKADADADAFMNGKKKVLIFSEAGGTGRSYHADLDIKNQEKRQHYLLQAGWRADKAVQGLGRTHRSNQKQPPKYWLVTTDLKGQARFISSIARRLDQLGALTKGARETGSQGIFSAKDNLETDYAEDALQILIKDLHRGNVPDMTIAEFEKQTALEVTDEFGNLKAHNLRVKNLLNRILSMRVNEQNRMFSEFAMRLDDVIDAHVEAGTLDVGLETLKADKIEKTGEETVHTDEKSGAETKYVHLSVTNPSPIFKYEDANKWAENGFYRNIKSDKVWAVRKREILDRRTGEIESKYILKSPTWTQQTLKIDRVEDTELWTKLDKKEAQTSWQKTVDELPATITEERHLITGALLPIWNRLIGHPRIMRVQTDAGEKMIGRIIAPQDLQRTLKNLGAIGTRVKLTPKEAHTQILASNYRLELANDWTLLRRRVSDDYRIEIQGPGYYDIELLKKYGVYSERIAYQTRYFIPTDASGVKAIEEIIRDNPVVEAIPPRAQYAVKEPAERKARIAVRPGEAGLSLEDIQGIFKGQDVGLSPDGSVWVRTKKGHGLVVRAVHHISGNRVAFEIGYGRMPKTGELVAGKYVDSTIELQKDVADKWTLYHELEHWAEDIGLLEDADIRALNAEIRAQTGKGIGDPISKEDRAKFIEKALEEREKYRDRGRLNRILQKIRDFIDALVNLAGRTARGVAREFETGTVFGRAGVSPAKIAAPEYEATAERWYSQMEKHLGGKLPGSGDPAQIKQTVQSWAKKGLIKQEELEWSGLIDYLDNYEENAKDAFAEKQWLDFSTGKDPLELLTGDRSAVEKRIKAFKPGKVTKKEVLDYLAFNNVRADEVLKGPIGKDYADDYVLESDMSWSEPEFIEPRHDDLIEEINFHKEQLLETERDLWLDEDGNIDTDRLDEEAAQIAYENYSEFGESTRITEQESGWSVRYAQHDDIYVILNAANEYVEQLEYISQIDGTDATLKAAQERVFEILEERGLAISDERVEEMEEGFDTRYSEYTLPGGENYKELLLTLPSITKRLPNQQRRDELRREGSAIAQKGIAEQRALTPAENKRYQKIQDEISKLRKEDYSAAGTGRYREYKSSHWPDDPNVVVHVRFDERLGPNGERLLHIAEIQSDWHAEGREGGYGSRYRIRKVGRVKEYTQEEFLKLDKHWPIDIMKKNAVREFGPEAENNPVWAVISPEGKIVSATMWNEYTAREKANLYEAVDAEGNVLRYPYEEPLRLRTEEAVRDALRRHEKDRTVPDVPFKKTWPVLAMKRMVRYAAENGFDAISWDPGLVQVERYDLSKQVDSIYARQDKDGYSLEIEIGPNRHKDELEGRPLSGLSEGQVEEMVGKDLAKKIVAKHGTKLANNWFVYRDEDLRVGGEGLKTFYDKLLPNLVNKYFKKAVWGNPKVKTVEVEGKRLESRIDWQQKQGFLYGHIEYSPTADYVKFFIERKEDGLYDLTYQTAYTDIEMVGASNTEEEAKGLAYHTLDKLLNIWADMTGGVTGRVAAHTLSVTKEMRSKAYREGMPLFKAIAPGPVMGKQAMNDLEKDRSFANRIFEQRDVGVKEAEHETQQLQKEVQRLAGVKSIKKHTLGFAYDKELKRSRESDMIDMAMMVYRDLQINPAKAKEFREWSTKMLADPVTPNSQKIQIKENLEVLDRAQKLTAAQAEFVDDIGRRFDRAFKIAKANKVVQAFHDHYVRRVWNLPKGKEDDFKSTGAAYGFKTTTTARLERKFETILDGWMAGYDLSIKGITSSYGAYISDLEAILANKDFIVQGYSTRDAENRRMFSTSSRGAYKDYAPLKAPGFKVWEWAGKAETEIAPDETGALIIDDYGRRFFFGTIDRIPEMWAVHKVDDEGVVAKRALRLFLNENQAIQYSREKEYETHVAHRPAKDVADAWERRELYAPKQLATLINKMTQGDQLFPATPALESIGRLNAGMKAWLLLSSFFHHIAGARSWAFGVHHGWRAGKTVVNPLTGEEFTTSGWNPVRAYKQGLKKIDDRAPIITMGIKNGLTLGELQDWSEIMLRERRGLADRLARHVGLEKVSKGIAYGRFMREKFTDSLFKKYFAGLKAEAFVMEYMHELQIAQTAHLEKGAPAPNVNSIAEKVARLINADFGGLHLQRMGRNPTLQKMMRLLLLAPDWTESNFRTVTGMIPGLNEFITKAVGDVKPPPGLDKIYRKFWGRVALRIALSTLIIQLLLNGTDESEEFWREQALTSRFRKNRWMEVDITSFYNALGIDPEGRRKTFSIGGHFFDPLKLFDPARLIKHKGSPMVRVIEAVAGGADWRERPFVSAKELITERKTVKESPYAKKEQFFDRLPAAAVNVVTNLQPVQVGYFIRWMQGEDDALSSLMRGAGMQVHTAYPAKIEGPIAQGVGHDEVYTAVQDLIKGDALTIGAPSRRIVIGGIPHKMTPAQYSEYFTSSSDLARSRLLKLVGSEKWEKMTPLQRAAVVEKVVRSSRKRARQKLKKRDFKVRYPSRWSKKEENLFSKWYQEMASKWGLNPEPDDPRHHYDYRRAYRAGATPDKTGHWPSKFKARSHPRRIVGGVDTITGRRKAA